MAVMNQNRNNQDGNDGYQNTARGPRYQNRGNPAQNYPNLNPNYQNPIDLIRNFNRGRQQQEPEENIYERLDNDDDDDRESNAEMARNEPLQNNQNNSDDHMYERIHDRRSCRGNHSRVYKYPAGNQGAGPSFLNDAESRNLTQYDQPRHIYFDSSRLTSQFCQSRLGRLGRNCFSTENIAYASTRRSVNPLAYGCMCPFCRHLDSRYLCHRCHSLHNRSRYHDTMSGNSRHYIYQFARYCRCPFCRVVVNRTETVRKECRCRNPGNCSCKKVIIPNSNSAIQIGRYYDWINKIGSTVNNPLYATIHIGRIDRSCLPSSSNSNNSSNVDAVPSTSGTLSNESGTASNPRSGPSGSIASVCEVNRSMDRQHICDDSCIRNQSGNLAGICQLLGRCERAECNHGRLSVHWWFVNKWLPSWYQHYSDRNVDTVPVEEEPREQRDSDSDDS